MNTLSMNRRSFAKSAIVAGLALSAGSIVSAGAAVATEAAPAEEPTAAAAPAPSPAFSVSVYDFGDVRLHAFNTEDALVDVCYIVEGADDLVGIETPAMVEDFEPWLGYIASLGKPFGNIWIANHPAGADHLEGVTVWGNQAAVDSITAGQVRATADGLAQTFGEAWDANYAVPTSVVEDGPVTVGGIDFVVVTSGDTYDLQIPAANAVYTHMLGKAVHSIIASVEGIDATIATLEGYQQQGFDLVLTSHIMPEGQDAVAQKIAYLQTARELAQTCATGADWQAAMQEAFAGYAGENYLQMSVGYLYPQA